MYFQVAGGAHGDGDGASPLSRQNCTTEMLSDFPSEAITQSKRLSRGGAPSGDRNIDTSTPQK